MLKKVWLLSAALAGTFLLSGGCGWNLGAVFTKPIPRAIWLWLSEDLVTH